MKTIYITKIDTTTDWFSSTVEHIESLTGAEADWGAIDSDQNALGDLMGYYRKDGQLYRAEHDPSRSDAETDCIVFEEQEESAYEITGDESGHGWLIESAISEAHALQQYYEDGDAEPHLMIEPTDDEAHMEYLRDEGQASGIRINSIAEKFAKKLGEDGQKWETDDGVSFEDLANQMGATVTYSAREYDDDNNLHYVDGFLSSYIADDPIRYEFPDGSAVVVAGAGWDLEGEEHYSWAGA